MREKDREKTKNRQMVREKRGKEGLEILETEHVKKKWALTKSQRERESVLYKKFKGEGGWRVETEGGLNRQGDRTQKNV